MRLRAIVAMVSVSALAACGGGSSGGGGGSVSPGGTVFANTSSAFYMPVHPGNTWTFTSGGKMVDAAPGTLVCSCTLNGTRYERIDLFDPTGAYGSSFLFTKYADALNGSVLTTALVGTSTDRGATITPFSSGRMPVMNDAPVSGYVYQLNGGTSTITSAGQVQTLSDGRSIRNVANDTVSAPGVQSISFGFAQGVGVTMVGVGMQTTPLASFSIDAVNSTSEARDTESARPSVLTKPADASSLAPLLAKLL
jgi:hypothetical protein